MEMRFLLLVPMHGRTDERKDGRTDGQRLIFGPMSATEKVKGKKNIERYKGMKRSRPKI